jgi:hypothetical protein
MHFHPGSVALVVTLGVVAGITALAILLLSCIHTSRFTIGYFPNNAGVDPNDNMLGGRRGLIIAFSHSKAEALLVP